MKNKIIIILTMLLLCGCTLFGSKKTEEEINEICEQNGYDVEFTSEDEFCIAQDGVEYYFESSSSGVEFVRYETYVDSKADYWVKDDKGLITVEVFENDKVSLRADYCTEDKFSSGEVYIFENSIGFDCTSEFTVDSIDEHCGSAILGKAEKYYNTITQDFISGDELRTLYDNGMDICEEFNN